MRIISIKTLKDYWQKEPEAEGELKAWYSEAKNATWKTPADVKAKYRNASILKGGRVVFNICGNKYRLVAVIFLSTQIVLIRFIGTHEEYNRINSRKI